MLKNLLIGFFVTILLISSFYFYKIKYKVEKKPQENKALTLTEIKKREVPNFDHIVLIILENKPSSVLLDNSQAPFLNSLIKDYSLAGNFSAIMNPSLPNYLALVGGSTFDITINCESCFIDKKNLVDELENKGKTWKAYMESMPKSCFLGSADPYAQKHNPFIYFNNIRNNKDRCAKIVPYTELEKDLTTGTLPNFIWITPNLCHDMHDCTVKIGDDWLKEEVGKILDSSLFKLKNSLLIVTFDEGYLDNNKIITIFAGSKVKKGFISQTPYDHYSLLKTIESAWDLNTLTENDQKASVMSDLFNN